MLRKKTTQRRRIRRAALPEEPHRQVRVEWDGMEARIDERLAPLILMLWQRQVWTLNCCQGSPTEDGYIQFGSSMAASEFLNLVCQKSRGYDSLYARAERDFIATAPHRRTGYRVWLFDASAVDLSDAHDASAFDFQVCVRFPRRDIARMTRAAKETMKKEHEAWVARIQANARAEALRAPLMLVEEPRRSPCREPAPAVATSSPPASVPCRAPTTAPRSARSAGAKKPGAKTKVRRSPRRLQSR